jgi:hypothetical protein
MAILGMKVAEPNGCGSSECVPIIWDLANRPQLRAWVVGQRMEIELVLGVEDKDLFGNQCQRQFRCARILCPQVRRYRDNEHADSHFWLRRKGREH